MAEKILITGINGFVGFHLTELLTKKNYDIAGFDIADNVEDKIIPRDIKVFEGDLRDEQKVNQILNKFAPDIIFHLAAQSSVKLSFENPEETFSVNVNGTLNILEVISGMESPPKILLISSSEIYGQLKPEQVPVSEESPFLPVNPYAVSKATVDLLAYQYYKAYKLPVYWARAFSHSGPGQRTVAVLSDWAFQMAKIELGLSVPEMKVGNMEVTRDYMDVRDTVKAYMAILEMGAAGQPYNVCSGKGFNLTELLEIMISFSSKKITVASDPSRMRPVDIPILIGSSDKLRHDTGWKPEIEIEKTLRDLFDYWINYLTPQIE